MDKVKIVWSGITGRTGKEALNLSQTNDFAEIVAGICRQDTSQYTYERLDDIKEEFDVIVDFSHKDSFDKVLDFALKVKKPIVSGTAGLSFEQLEALEKASHTIPVFRGGNFRWNVKTFIDAVVEYAKSREEDSLELIETHYKTKKVPSETAKVIARKVKEETGKNIEISSFLEYDDLINDWKVGNLHCRVVGFKELAADVLKIAAMMKNKKADGLYDLDRLLKEQNLLDLHHFLIEAKKQTYANGSIKKSISTRTYFGGTQFMGEEIVYLKENPFWGMNYYGVTLDKTFSEEAIDKALRPALMKVGEGDILPVRGPKEFISGEYKYTFKVTGDLENFDGEETISKDTKKVYVLKCHGGIIQR